HHTECMLNKQLFEKNAQACGISVTPRQLIQNLYGWISFCPQVPLDQTLPKEDFNAAASAYYSLQYSFNPGLAENFNPYTQLIHEALKMNVYAYSIDDAVGNINTLGSGLVISIGGGRGLSNSLQYKKADITTINPGTPPPGSEDPFF